LAFSFKFSNQPVLPVNSVFFTIEKWSCIVSFPVARPNPTYAAHFFIQKKSWVLYGSDRNCLMGKFFEIEGQMTVAEKSTYYLSYGHPYLTQSYLLLLCFTKKLYGLLLLYRDDKEWVFYTVRTQEDYIYLEKERFQLTIETMPLAYCALF
jgi:hypothetical protein